jgi:hypothetical protein
MAGQPFPGRELALLLVAAHDRQKNTANCHVERSRDISY